MEQSIRLERRFAIIDEWLLNLDISDRAVRLYAVLARYADSETHKAYPSRATLAERLRCSRASVDRAALELVDAGAMTKKQRHNSSIVYTLQVSSPMTRGVLTHDEGGSSQVMRGVITGDELTRTTELEPDNYIEKKAKKARSIPDRFALSDSLREAMMVRHPSLELDEQVDAFVDFHTAKGSVFRDWDAAFRTWCRNAVKFAEPRTVIHKQALKPAAEGPTERGWVLKMHDIGEHWECRPGEFGCK